MRISHKTMYQLVNAAIVVASLIQLIRGYKWFIVLICAATFAVIGNLTVRLAGSKQRAIERKRKRDYYAS